VSIPGGLSTLTPRPELSISLSAHSYSLTPNIPRGQGGGLPASVRFFVRQCAQLTFCAAPSIIVAASVAYPGGSITHGERRAQGLDQGIQGSHRR